MYRSGERLRCCIQESDDAERHLGRRTFRMDQNLLFEAKTLARSVTREKRAHIHSLIPLVLPVMPMCALSTILCLLMTVLRSRFHQLGVWIEAIEAGVAGDIPLAHTLLLRLWVAHMLIKIIDLPASTLSKRASATMGMRIRNAVFQAMVSQDFEYFDRNPAGVLQDRLNKDADELGENLIQVRPPC